MRINLNLYPDPRYKKNSMRIYAYISYSWLDGYQYRKFATTLEISRDFWDFKKKVVKGSSLEATTIRDRLFKIRDFGSSLNHSTPEENIAELKAFIGIGEEVNKPLKIVRLVDFVNEFIKINTKKYSYHTTRKYKTLIRNLEMYCSLNKLVDSLPSLTRDQQTIFFSGYVDFLTGHETKGKKLYENGSVKEDFKLIKAVCATFDAGLKVKLDFADSLGEGNIKRTYCTPEEVMTIYKASKTVKMSITEEKAIDCWLFQAFTGPRHGDLYQVEESRLTLKMSGRDSYKVWTYIPEKNKNETTVPLNHICLGIIEKWRVRGFKAPERKDLKSKDVVHFNNCLLPVLPSSKMNKAIHDFLERLPEFQRVHKITRYIGDKRVDRDVPRYDLITTHVARHSYSHLLSSGGLTMDESGALLNHSSGETTRKHYQHFDEEQLQLKALKVLNG